MFYLKLLLIIVLEVSNGMGAGKRSSLSFLTSKNISMEGDGIISRFIRDYSSVFYVIDKQLLKEIQEY